MRTPHDTSERHSKSQFYWWLGFRWTNGTRESWIHDIKRKLIQNNTKRSSSYTKQRRGLSSSYSFNFPTAQKLKSKAQSLPHVHPSTALSEPRRHAFQPSDSVRLSHPIRAARKMKTTSGFWLRRKGDGGDGADGFAAPDSSLSQVRWRLLVQYESLVAMKAEVGVWLRVSSSSF